MSRGRDTLMSLNCAELSAAILVGGRGTRLRKVVNDRPKVLAPVGGRPFLYQLFDQLVAAGVRKVVLCSGYMAEPLRRAVGDSYCSLKIRYSVEPEPLDTAGALRLAAEQLDSDPFLAMNGDSYTDLDLAAYLQWFQAVGAVAALLLTEAADTGRYGRVEQDRSGRIVSFSEKGQNASQGWINAGVYLFRRAVLDRIPAGVPWSLERSLLPDLLPEGLFGFHCRGAFIDIGTPQSYATAERLFTAGNIDNLSTEGAVQ